jgi:hypothetical protein
MGPGLKGSRPRGLLLRCASEDCAGSPRILTVPCGFLLASVLPRAGRGRAETASAMYFAVLCQTARMKLRSSARSNYQQND